ncbi:hypothetical protein ACQ4PT_029262 [Festuca glaucescens]
MARPRVSALPREMLQEILVKLPTADILRCCCVCTLWRSVVRNASFQQLHAARYVGADKDLALLVSEKCEPGGCAEAGVFDVSSGKIMCSVANVPGYRLANLCNGFLCFAPHSGDLPAVVCNPVTGQKVELPEAPPLGGLGLGRRHVFALGFSPSTNEYKLFRLSSSMADDESTVDVCTLGDRRGWRQHPYMFPHRPVDDGSPPVFVGGTLYVVTCRGDRNKRPDRILQIDVASEEHRTYRLPDFEEPVDDVRVSVFELSGQLCLAVNTVNWYRPKLIFWIMAVDSNEKGHWHPRYSFFLDAKLTRGGTMQYDCYSNLPRGAWLDDDGMLCYRVGDTLYMYDTNGYSLCPHVDTLTWDEQLQLPATGEPPSDDRSWNVFGGYRPTLLSPLTLVSPPSEEKFEHILLRALRSHKSKQPRRSAPSGCRTCWNQRAAKRIRSTR